MTSSEKMDVLLERQVVTVYPRDVKMKDAVVITQMAITKMCREKTLYGRFYITHLLLLPFI